MKGGSGGKEGNETRGKNTWKKRGKKKLSLSVGKEAASKIRGGKPGQPD